MNHTSKLTVLPALTTDLLQDSGILIDNVFATLWQQIGMKTLLNRSGFTKRSGIPIHEVVYTLSLWLWLKKESIWMFACDSLQGMGKDVLYDTLNREDLNWRDPEAPGLRVTNTQHIYHETRCELWTSDARRAGFATPGRSASRSSVK